jgi:CBS domain-containing protein
VILSYARREVVTAEPDERVADLAGLMDYYQVGCVVIVDGGRPVGIVTDRDLALRVLLERRGDAAARDFRAADVMTTHPRTIHEDEGFDRALELMRSENVRRLPVVDRHGKLRGIVSLDDLLEQISADMRSISILLKHQQRLAPALHPASTEESLPERR